MTNDNIERWQLKRVGKEVVPHLIEQLPWLAEVSGNEVTRENWREWLAEQALLYGAWHGLYAMHPEDHEHIDPIQELIDGVGEDKVLLISIDDAAPDSKLPGAADEVS